MSQHKTTRKEASSKAPCLVCEGQRGCSIGEDGLIMCRGSSGERPGFRFLGKAKGDPAWNLYRVDTAEPFRPPHSRRAAPQTAQRSKPKSEPNRKKTPWVMQAQQFAGELTTERRLALAAHLRLPVESIDALFYVGSTKDRREGMCWTFPEQDGEGEIIGIVRRREDGRKRSMAGGARGLTITRDWEERDGPVYVAEGASCTMALAAMGLAAVGRPSNTGGVAHLTKLFETLPADREIIVLGEWDAKTDGKWPGLDGCKAVAAGLAAALRRPICWALPPDRAKDVRGWLNIHLQDWSLAKPALMLGQHFASLIEPELIEGGAAQEDQEGVVLRSFEDIESAVLRWLVPGFFPAGELIMLAGDGGEGKSFATMSLAAALTRGEPAFDLAYPPLPPKHVILMACEDDASTTLRPRLLATDAVLSRVHLVDGVRDKKGKLLPFSLAHIDLLDRCLEKISDVGLVLIDPVSAYLVGTQVNPGRDEEVRTLIEPLRLLGRKHDVTIIMVKHFNKSSSPKASTRIADSAVWRNSCRACFVVFPDDEEDGRKLFLCDKLNGGPMPHGLMYRIRPCNRKRMEEILADLPAGWTEDDKKDFCNQLATVEWLGETDRDSNTVSAALASIVQDMPGETDGPAEFLKKYLADGPAQVESTVLAGNTSLQINRPAKWWRDRVLKMRLGGFSAKGKSFTSGWYFCLPGQEPPSPMSS